MGPGRACASHFKVVNPLDKIVVSRDDDPLIPPTQRNKQVFPNCCYPRVNEHGTPSPSNVQYTAEAIWVYKHAWRGAGAYYRKGDHKQKRKTGNTPVEFKALRMFPEWERWIAPKPTFLAEQLLKEAAALAKGGEPKNRVKKHNIFEHFKDGFEPHTLTTLPPIFQAFKEYKERSKLDPNKGNLWGLFWESCTLRDRGFWEAGSLEHARCSNTDDAKVYHAIKFGQDHPNYKPTGDEVPKDRPVDNDQRFSYYTTVKRWDTCQVAEERTIRVATDKVNSWLVNPEMTATFPPSHLEANQPAKPTAAGKASGKGAKKRQSSVPPDSEQSKKEADEAKTVEASQKAGTGKGRPRPLSKQEQNSVAMQLITKVQEKVTDLQPRHYRALQALGPKWYNQIYYTKYQISKADYLKTLHDASVGETRAKETIPE